MCELARIPSSSLLMPARPPENVTDTITVVSNTFHVLNFGSGTGGMAM